MPGSLLSRVGSSRSTISKEHKCTVQLLDDTQTFNVDFKKDDLGQVVLDYVCDMLNLVEKDYFGLRYVDANRHRYWLDTAKPILRQVKSGSPIVFAFRVQYYPIDPSILYEQLTRYLITSQLRRDLLHGRLYCPQNDAALLGAYIMQAELGDYDPTVHQGDYVSQFKLFLNQTPRLEDKIAAEHQKLKGKGITASDADLEFLKKACALDTYGYYPFTVKDAKNGQVYVGATPRGILIYQAHKKLHHLRWEDLKSFDYNGKEFFIYTSEEYFNEHNLTDEAASDILDKDENGTGTMTRHDDSTISHKNDKKKACLRFVCPSATFCKHFWKYMLGQQAFFTKPRSTEVKPVVIRRGPMFRRATFRFAGRVLQEIKEAPSPRRTEPAFERVHAPRQLTRDERNPPWANKFHTLPRSMKPVPEEPTTVVKTKPTEKTMNRESVILTTTSQITPAATPVTENGPMITGFTDGIISNGPTKQAYSMVETASAKTTAPGYQSEVITVCLKRIDPSGLHESVQSGMVTSTQESQKRVEKHNGHSMVNGRRKSMNTMNGDGDAGRALNIILTSFMFLILVVATVIIIMEVQDPQFRGYVSRITGNDAFRRNVYDPVRQSVLNAYGRVFH